jgi:hypothetical protein
MGDCRTMSSFRQTFASGAKALIFSGCVGTAEAVPSPKEHS